jgi:membrane protease YdiL (CAAX protease family)
VQQITRPIFSVSIFAIMIFQVAALFARSALEVSLITDGHQAAFAEDLSYLVVPPILAVLMFPYLRRCKRPLLELLKRTDFTLRLVVLSILLGLTLRVTYWAVLTLLIWLGIVGNVDPRAVIGPIIGFACPPLPVTLFSVGVVGILIPTVEEIVNRAFILHALLPRNVVAAVVISAALFAAMHRPSSYVLAFAIGSLLGIQILNYRTLWAPLITHATYNAATVLDWECFRLVWNPPASDPRLLVLAGISVPVALAGTLAALFLVSKKAAGVRMVHRQA